MKGHLIGCLAACAMLCAAAAPAPAADYEVRMPVEKTTRMPQAGELPAESAKGDPAKADSAKAAKKPVVKKLEPAKAEPADTGVMTDTPVGVIKADPKGEPGKATAAKAKKAAKPAPSKAESAKPAAPEAKAAEAVPAQPEAVAPAPAPVPAPKPAPKPKPVPPAPPVRPTDPKAFDYPPAPAGPRVATPLPTEGLWAGDVDVEFQERAVVLHVATSAQAERITWFNLADPAGPRKLALDLRGQWRKKGPSVLRFDTGPVKAVVAGEHEDRLRLSVEFRDGAVAPALDPRIESDPHGASITIPLAVQLRR